MATSKSTRVSRRRFLQTTAAASTVFGTFTIVPRHVIGQGQTPPSETFGGALIGANVQLTPEMTSGGRVFRLRGHGMPTVGKPEERGDLYATVDLQIPSEISPEERQHFEALRALEQRR